MTPHPTDRAPFTSPPTPPGHLSAHTLGRHAADDLPPDARAAADAHLAACPACQARLDADLTERRAFLTLRPAPAFAAALASRRARRAPWWARIPWPAALATAATVAAVALLVPRFLADPPPSPTPEPVTRLKTPHELTFHLRSGGHVTLGQPGAVVRPGDAIQLRYSSPRPAHLVVVSLDSAGAVTPFYDDAGRALAVPAGVAQLLDGAVVLDATLGPERVIGCFSDTPLPTADVVAAAERALAAAHGDPAAVASLPLPCPQATFLLRKQAP